MEPERVELRVLEISDSSISRELFPTRSERFIYRLHKHLRCIKDKAYEPEVIAIGPYHHGKQDLRMMEDVKWAYLNSLIEGKREMEARIRSRVAEMEPELRQCYADQIDLPSRDEFIQMMVLDGCFIVQLLRTRGSLVLRDGNDPIFQMGWMLISVQRDLMLFENQIPFNLVSELFGLIASHGEDLVSLVSKFFGSLYPGGGNTRQRSRNLEDIKHLLHMIHDNWLPSEEMLNKIGYQGSGGTSGGSSLPEAAPSSTALAIIIRICGSGPSPTHLEEAYWLIQSCTKLAEANVKLKRHKSAGSLFEIEFDKGTLALPPITIQDNTETFLRNLIAYEQYFGTGGVNFVTDYITFFDCLINSGTDVEMLCKHKIINNWLGDDEAVANMFNKLGDSVTCSEWNSFIYAKIFRELNDHCGGSINRWMANLRHKYFYSPWAIVSSIAAAALLLLTITQTVFSVLEHLKK